MKKITMILLLLLLQACGETGETQDSTGDSSEKSPLVAPVEPVSSVFQKIYDEGKWGVDTTGKGTSGPGSDPKIAKPYLEFLKDFIRKNDIKSIVDVGCGDWQIMSQLSLDGIKYIGFDVADSVVKQNKMRFGKENIEFVFTNDATEADLPSADLLIVKEVLQHLPNSKIFSLFKKISRYRHVLFANDMVKGDKNANNYEIEIGGWRPLDLRAEPFNLAAVEALYYKSNHNIQVLHVNNFAEY